MTEAPFKPMLAVPMSKAKILDWLDWAIEEKYDGWRLIVEVAQTITAWTRPSQHAGAEGKTMLVQALPVHLMRDLSRLPYGVYDGELMSGVTSSDVSRLDLVDQKRFVVFDVLRSTAGSTAMLTYDQRRAILETIFQTLPQSVALHLAPNMALTCLDDVSDFVKAVWARGGEGAILKQRTARYFPGKRSPVFVKVKKLQTAVCTVVGFAAGRGEKVDRGPFAMVLLQDAKGNATSVKTRNDAELAAFAASGRPDATHPALGRKLRIEYQDFTPTDGYRHPRWDRFEDE